MLKLNPNIKITNIEELYYIEDRSRSQLYRIASPEHKVLQFLTQNLSIEGIEQKLKQNNLHIPSDQIQNFKTRILELGILKEDSAKQTPVEVQSAGTNIFHLCFPLFNPSRFLKWLANLKISRYIFSLPFLLVILSIIGSGIVIFLRNNDVLMSSTSLFQTSQYIPIFLLVFLASTLLHELSHGLVCTYYGGKAKEIGIGIFYFIPSFYISLEGIWLFKKTFHKILTYFSGLVMDFFICSLFLILCRLFLQSNIILLFSKIVILSAIIRTIFVINPFIESDFYRILTHLFNISNLRQKAFSTIYGLIRRNTKTTRSLTKRERKVSILYGVSSITFWIIVLTSTTFLATKFLTNV